MGGSTTVEELRAELARAQEISRLKTAYLARMSHDLRTPLNAIINIPLSLIEDYPKKPAWVCTACEASFEAEGEKTTAQTCEACGKGELKLTDRHVFDGSPEMHAQLLTRIIRASQHLMRLVDNILTISKIESGVSMASRTQVDLAEMFAEIENTLGPLASAARVTITYPNFAGMTVFGDRTKVSQIFTNLLANAVQYTDPDGSITVRVEAAELNGSPGWRFAIADTGIGIPNEKFDVIFDSFRRLEAAEARGSGTGLGLAIVKQFVQLHRGEISLESTLGKGTTFTVVLPRS